MNIDQVKINSDLGEGTGIEKDIMPYLTSCSIACGGHTGDKSTMKNTILIAKKHGVKVGAHPSYPDKENFGRKKISISKSDLISSLKNQINELDEICNAHSITLDHIKLHGALYNFSVVDVDTASTIVELMKKNYPDKILYVPYGSLISELALEKNIKINYEVFLDRNYNDDLSLVSRSKNNSMILDHNKMLNRLKNVIIGNKIQTVNGNYKKIIGDTFCVHGDSPKMSDIIKSLFADLKK
tara:strand:- start:922 stop:1644 length:723 start_codon:yes stop_codon:yes gene_type:complete